VRRTVTLGGRVQCLSVHLPEAIGEKKGLPKGGEEEKRKDRASDADRTERYGKGRELCLYLKKKEGLKGTKTGLMSPVLRRESDFALLKRCNSLIGNEKTILERGRH